ncbi:MAG: Omp28-related outer membrane protein [Prevotella sp.]|nr:Omp28-related outer membrane protein [Prevotella sp.]
MRKTILLLLATLSLSVHGQQRIDPQVAHPARWDAPAAPVAQATAPRKVDGLSATQRPVGYIFDHNPDSITHKGVMTGTAGTYPVGVAIPPSILDPYAGCKVVGIRMAAARTLGKTNTFLYTIANNTLSSPLTKSQRLYEGWNNVFFNGDTSLEIEEGMTLLAGFEYVETEQMVEEESGGLCTVGESAGNDFLIYSDFGSGMGWYSISNLGALCVQLIVDVSNLPQKALEMAYLDTGFRYKRAGERVEMYVIAANTGREDINGYHIACQLDDSETVTFDYDKTLREQSMDHQQPVLTLPQDISIGRHVLHVNLLAEDETAAANEAASDSAIFYVYDHFLARQQNYVEQYNSQNEYMASIVNPLINQVANGNKEMALVNVHAPGTPLAIDEGAYLHTLYAYTLPSFTVNRSYFPGENYIAYDVNDYATQYASLVPSIISELVQQDMSQPAFATIDIEARYDEETRQLTVDVTGDLADGALDILGTPSLTLLLTEDNVHSQQMVLNKVTQRTTMQSDYTHHHVLRQFVTSPLGAPVEVSGSHYTAHHSTTLDPSWNPLEMTLVAFITRPAEEVTNANVLQMDITNCNSLPLAPLTTIHALESNVETETTEYHLTNGQRVSGKHLAPGIYIIRQGGKSKKVVVK